MYKLSTQDFASVVTALRSQPESKGHEQRTASRLDVGGKATVWWMADGQVLLAVNVFIQDLSLTGLGMLCGRRTGEGETFVLGLSRGMQEPLLVGCETLRVTELADGVFRVGARFVRVIARTKDRPSAEQVPAST